MAQTRTENLALHFQEVLTAIVRLRANRQAVSDAESLAQCVDGTPQCPARVAGRHQ